MMPPKSKLTMAFQDGSSFAQVNANGKPCHIFTEKDNNIEKVALVQCPQQNIFKTRYKYVQMIREDIPSHNVKKKIMTKNSISLVLINNL